MPDRLRARIGTFSLAADEAAELALLRLDENDLPVARLLELEPVRQDAAERGAVSELALRGLAGMLEVALVPSETETGEVRSNSSESPSVLTSSGDGGVVRPADQSDGSRMVVVCGKLS